MPWTELSPVLPDSADAHCRRARHSAAWGPVWFRRPASDGRHATVRERIPMDTARRWALCARLLTCMVLAFSPAARAESRTALVIGNGAYAEGPLRNPPNDAQEMGKVLRQCGFSVTVVVDASKRDMQEAIRTLGRQLAAGGVGLFYYAGHGVQVDGTNYLVPVGAAIKGEADVEYECVDAGRVLKQMEEAGNGVNIVVLDACRNNPFPRSFRSATRGLARMDAPKGSLLAYSTAPGDVAADGAGANGLYTSKLLARLQQPGLSVVEVFNRTGQDVMRATAGSQVPWIAMSPMGDFCFAPPAPGSPAPPPEPITPPPPVVAQTAYLQVSVNAPDARVYVNGALRGTAGPWQPLNLTGVRPGAVTVRVTAQGYAEKTQRATLTAGQWTPVLVELMPVAAVVAPAPAATSTPHPQPGPAVAVAGTPAGETHTFPLPGGASMEFVWMPPGTFTMGSPELEPGRDPDERQHQVSITRGFWLGEYEVTQGQWEAVVGYNPSRFAAPDRPVEQVSWDDAQRYVTEANRGEGRPVYRLPTEAEWEYACRAGTKTAWSFGAEEQSLQQYGWCSDPTGATHTVGVRAPNAWGVCDMHGNVWEWCQDWYGWYGLQPVADPVGPDDGTGRVLRGGAYNHYPRDARSTNRRSLSPGTRDYGIGCRLVRTP